ncbi:MAG: hypothetical protein Q4D96_07675 [Propionibacteriaceae bacterium]|nr:hypothetical protein [Propionibacteriaceae bacterium]
MKRVTVLAVLTTAMLLGCAPKQEQPREPLIPPPTTYSIPTPTAPQSYTPVKSLERQAAEKAVREYFRLKNELRKNPSLSLDPLEKIVDGEKPLREVEMLQEKRDTAIVQVGDVTAFVTDSRLLEEARVEVTACTDATGVELKDSETDELVSDPDRPRYVSWVIIVVRFGEHWRIADFTSQAGEPCA